MLKKHYNKILPLCCFLFLFVNMGLPNTSFNVYQPYLVETPYIGDTGGSIILSLRTLVSLLTLLIVDRYYHLLDVRKGILIACSITTLGFVIFGFAHCYPMFLLGAICTGAGYGLGGMVAMTLLVSRWFESKVGGIIGLATLGSSVAAVIVPIGAVFIIEHVSLSTAFFVEAGLALCVSTISVLLLRNRPSDLGLEPYRGPAEKKSVKKKEHVDHNASKKTLHILTASTAMLGACSMTGTSYLSVLLTTEGFDPIFAATMLSVCGASLAISKYVTGKMMDKIGTRTSSRILYVILLVGFAAACASPLQIEILAFIASLCLGFGISLGTVGVSIWSIELSSRKNRARVAKSCQVGFAFGGFVTTVIPGPLRILTGSYVTTYVMLLALAVVSMLCILTIYRKKESSAV